MSGMDKYIMDVDYDYDTGEEHTTIIRTDKTQNMENWEILVTTMYTHHSIFEDVVAELNRLNDENEQLRELLEVGLDVSQVEIDEELERMSKNRELKE